MDLVSIGSSWLQPEYVLTGTLMGIIGMNLATDKVSIKTSNVPDCIYLLSLAGTFGTQLFHNFIQDPVLVRLMPRHQYGRVSGAIIAKYFFTVSLFTGVSSCLYLRFHPVSTWQEETRLLVRHDCISTHVFIFQARLHFQRDA